ncbi:proton-associated sugar transporter A-like [Toxorhynchites rutilus septentrionalis]|uniref:proton-associated sugar transporter A-like n=1 Tax=Toxorhynchites rutilus septentrionalis TaxID=329112 RepID=UPI00247989A7|nr:proton-associated sugar transporter A-like [Toxorhynchites rutilus septentrionalis]
MMDIEKSNIDSRILEAQIMEKLLQKRYEHAKRQPKDYSHLFRPKTRWEMVRLTLHMVGIQFTYAVETAFVSPILLGIGLTHTYMTMIWAISPTLGAVLAPLIASISDQIRLDWGRRRPVLLALGVGLIIGLLILPNGRTVGLLLADDDVPVSQMTGFRWGVLITVLGLIMMDFNVETSNGVSRTYFMDMCIKEDRPKVITTAVMIGGIGGFAGYMLGSIDWAQTDLGNLLGSNEVTMFAAVVIVVLIGLTTTLTSYHEVPLALMEQDELLRPITRAVFEEEKKRELSLLSASSVIPIGSEKLEVGGNSIDEDTEKSLSFSLFLKNLIRMPKALRILYFTQFLSHLGYLSYCLYFTDFVGREIFNGDAIAPEGSQEYELYNQGVRFGSLGLGVFILSSSLYSVIIERLIGLFRARKLYIVGLMLNSLGMIATGLVHQKFAVFICCITMGIKYATIFSIPFLLISQYHTKNSFEIVNGTYVRNTQNRGFGADVSTLSSMLFLAQVVISLTIGSVIDAFGTTTIVMYSASLFSGLAAISATQIAFMDL